MGTDTAGLRDGKRNPVVWDTKKLINGHMLIVGKSGTGKTHTLRRILNQISESPDGKNVRVHIMDVHGDIEINGASTVKFSEATPYGLNPLIINPDPDFGGVRKRIQSFMATLTRTGYRLGSKQEAALRNLLLDLYAAHEFFDHDPNSWKINDGLPRRTPKTFPAMEDAVSFARAKVKGMFLGTSSEAVAAVEKLYRKQTQFHNKLKREGRMTNKEELEALKVELKNLADECLTLYGQHLESMQTGQELTDLIKYDSKDVMKGVVDRLENLQNIGIFRPKRPPFDRNSPLWRYDIKALAPNEKKLFVSFILEAIFQNASQRGVKDDLVEIVVLDEAHLFLTDDPDNPINIIAKEARKFGLGLFAASQSPVHFSEDFLSNVSTKIILGIDQMYWDASVRKLKMKPEALEWIVPHQKMIIQMNNKGQAKSQFLWVALDKS